MTTPVKFELAKLLKEKGYDNPTRDCYNVHGLSFSNGWCEYIEDDFEFDGLVRANKLRKEDTLAPTIAEVVMWLYEKHGIWISVDFNFKTSWFYDIVILSEEGGNILDNFNSPTEAYEAAIEYCLTNLV